MRDRKGVPEPDAVVTLPDGRRLGLDDVGDPDGTPVVYLHGSPDCRLARHPDDGIAARLGVRLLAVDRPGWASSDPHPAPTVGALGADIEAVLDHLGLARAGLLAWSAGAPTALGAATLLGDRVTALVCFGAVPPAPALADPDVREASGPRLGVARAVADVAHDPVAFATLVADIGAMVIPTGPIEGALARAHVADVLGPLERAEVAATPGALEALAASVAVVAQTGSAGLAADLLVQFVAPLDVDLAAVTTPTRFVHGELDHVAGPGVGRWLAAQVPGAVLDVVPGTRHHGIFTGWEDLLAVAAGQHR